MPVFGSLCILEFFELSICEGLVDCFHIRPLHYEFVTKLISLLSSDIEYHQIYYGRYTMTQRSKTSLGTRQEKVLFFIAENPDLDGQAIWQGLRYPPDQTGNVYTTTKKLEKLEFIKSKEGFSKKKVKIKLYSCTEKGILYTITYNPIVDVIRVLDNCKDEYNLCNVFRAMHEIFGHDLFMNQAKNIRDMLPMVQSEGLENVAPFFFMKIFLETKNLDAKKRKKIAKEILSEFPNTKRMEEE